MTKRLRVCFGDLAGSRDFLRQEIPIISEALDDKIVGIPNGEDQKKLKKIDEYKGEPDKFKDSTPG